MRMFKHNKFVVNRWQLLIVVNTVVYDLNQSCMLQSFFVRYTGYACSCVLWSLTLRLTWLESLWRIANEAVDEGLTLETSAFNPFKLLTVANLRYQLRWLYLINLWHLLPTQHNSFYRNLPPSLICIKVNFPHYMPEVNGWSCLKAILGDWA